MASAVVCGVVLGGGLWLFLVRLPFLRPISFAERIGPQLRSHNLESRLLRATPGNVTPSARWNGFCARWSVTGYGRWAG